MGQVVSAVRSCAGIKKKSKHNINKSRNDHITILVIGDRDVGKTTLINNYLQEHTSLPAKEEALPINQGSNNALEDTVLLDENGEVIETSQHSVPGYAKLKNTEKLRIKNSNIVFNENDTNYNVGISIVEINGSLDMMEKQMRESYYSTADIVFIMYNIGKVDSLYHVEKVWYPEIEQNLNESRQKSEMQIVVVGVNPECRDTLEESEIYRPAEDDVNETLFKRNTLRKSVGKGQGERLSQKLNHKNSVKKTLHYEVQKDRLKVIDFFSNVVKDFIMSKDFGSSQ